MNNKIVVLDGYTLNPGDLSWEPFEKLGAITVYDRTPADQIRARASGAQYLLTNKTPLTAETLMSLPDLRYIGVLATGFNVVDADAARQRSIPVTNIPTYGTDSVAQHAIALTLELARGVAAHAKAVAEGQWSNNDDWCFSVSSIEELAGRTMGIIGLGRIGLAVARIGDAMGMRLIAHDAIQLTAQQLDGLSVQYKDLDHVFSESDVLSLHCPLTDQTRHLVNDQRLDLMKSNAFLINTSRGPLVDADALARALHERKIAGAGLDVLDQEPPAASNPLLKAPHCIITPHVAWYAKASRQRLIDTAAANLRAFLDGTAVHVVNP